MTNPTDLYPTAVEAVSTALAGGGSKTAYDLTKICCDAITRTGQRIPSWMTIRTLIGKGSANDINRGKADYLAELGEQVRKQDDYLAVIPEELIRPFLDIWSHARKLADAGYDEARRIDEARIEEARSLADDAAENLLVSTRQVERLESEVKFASKNTALLSDQLAETKANARNNEKRYETRLEEKSQQYSQALEELESEQKAHVSTQEDLQSQISQLQGSLDESNAALVKTKRDNEFLDRRCSTEEENAKNARAAQEEITTRFELLTTEFKALSSRFEALSTEHGTLREELAASRAAQFVMSDDNARLREEIAGYKKEERSLTAELVKVKTEHEQLKKLSSSKRTKKASPKTTAGTAKPGNKKTSSSSNS